MKLKEISLVLFAAGIGMTLAVLFPIPMIVWGATAELREDLIKATEEALTTL